MSDAAKPGAAVRLIDPDMPAQELRLHLGEMTAQEVRTARAAIRWANAQATEVAAQASKVPHLEQRIHESADAMRRAKEHVVRASRRRASARSDAMREAAAMIRASDGKKLPRLADDECRGKVANALLAWSLSTETVPVQDSPKTMPTADPSA
jgi:hypothetical protein